MLTYIFFLLIFAKNYAQNEKPLKELNNNELFDLFYEAVKEDTLRANKIANIFVQKNIAEKTDTVTLLDGYTLLIESDLHNHQKYIDTINYYSNFLDSKLYYPANGYFITALSYMERKKFNEALDKFIISKRLAAKSNNNYIEQLSYMSIGLIKLERVNNEKEALKIFKDLQIFFKDEKYKKGYPDFYGQLNFNLAEAFQRLNKIDSAQFYTNYGREFSIASQQKNLIGYFDYEQGIIDYKKGNYKEALVKLSGSLESLEKVGDFANILINHYYQGLTCQKLGDVFRMNNAFKKVDSIFDAKPMYTKEVRQLFFNLKNKYKSNKDFKNQLKYLNKLSQVDSIYLKDFRDLTHNFNELNSESLESERIAINSKLENQRKRFNIFTISYIVLLVLIISILVFYISKYFAQKKQFLALMANTANTPKQNTNHFSLSDDKEKELLLKLEAYEKSNGFLKKDILIQDFAKNNLGSNDKYLRSILSKYKDGLTFTDYLNKLRINWFVNKIKEDKSYRKFTLKTYAEDCGFQTYSTFARAFEKQTKLKPHYFLNQVVKISNSTN
ncbi:MAG: hypothetical protein V3V33_13000 [Candidatus Lokiarchaeia archaeon]